MQKLVCALMPDGLVSTIISQLRFATTVHKGTKTVLIIVTLQFGEHVPLCHYSYASVYYIYGLTVDAEIFVGV